MLCGLKSNLVFLSDTNDIEYKLKIVFVVWFGTHKEYDKIDAKTVRYEN